MPKFVENIIYQDASPSMRKLSHSMLAAYEHRSTEFDQQPSPTLHHKTICIDMELSAKEALQLPFDIIHTVFDHLRDDKKSLAACSLVHKAWEPPSRSRLFHSVKRKPSYVALEDFLATVPHLSGYIRELWLVGHTIFEWTRSGPEIIYDGTLEVPLLARILTKLPSLRRLYLEDLAYEGVSPLLPQARRPSLDLLVFRHVPPLSHRSNTLPELLSVIGSFSSIGHLALIGDNVETEHVRDADVTDDYEIPGQVNICTLELKHLSSKVVAAVTYAIGENASHGGWLKTLSLSLHDTYGCIAIVGDFLARFRHSIKHLCIDPMVLCIRSDAEYDEWDSLRLSECLNLKSLTLSLELPPIMSRCYEARERCFYAYERLLSQPIPSSLEVITLRLGATKPDVSISSLEWAKMDRVLGRIPSLVSFVVTHCCPPSCGADGSVSVESFTSLVPTVHERGILEFRSE